MEPLLAANPALLAYQGKGCSLGFIGHSALHWSAAKNNPTLAKWLIGKGANLSAINNAESTPLHTSAQNGSSKVAELLLEAGASVHLLNADGQTPLAVALERGHSAVVTLLQRGAVLDNLLLDLSGREEATWKVADMKKALTLGGVDIDGVADKSELVSLSRTLIAKQPPPRPPDVSEPPAAAAGGGAAGGGAAGAAADASSSGGGGGERAGAAAGFFAAAGAGKVKERAASEKAKAAAAAERAEAEEAEAEEDEEDAAANVAGSDRCKAKGNELFAAGNFEGACKQFTMAIRMTPKNPVLFSNRSVREGEKSSGRAQQWEGSVG